MTTRRSFLKASAGLGGLSALSAVLGLTLWTGFGLPAAAEVRIPEPPEKARAAFFPAPARPLAARASWESIRPTRRPPVG